jgi:hypothetical protein
MRTIKGMDERQGLTLYSKPDGFCGVADRDGNEICGVQSFTVSENGGVAEITLTAHVYAPREQGELVDADRFTGAGDIIPPEDIGPIIADIERQVAEEVADDG